MLFVSGITPLMFATAMEDDPSFTILMANKVDPSIKNYLGLTASDIKKSREIKEEKPAPPVQQPMKQPQLTPAELISKSPHMSPFTNPGHFISPQPTFLVIAPEQAAFHHIRKSSNAATPANCFIATPHLTPIGTMALVPQIFFPPDFGGNVSHSPGVFHNSFNSSNDLLNAHINMSHLSQTGFFLSPSYSPANGYLSPCI